MEEDEDRQAKVRLIAARAQVMCFGRVDWSSGGGGLLCVTYFVFICHFT